MIQTVFNQEQYFLELDKGKYFDLVIYANKKFSGGVGDEDEYQPDDNEDWKKFCLQDLNTASKVVAISKVNGEAAHISGR